MAEERTPFEQALASLVPHSGGLDQDRILFRAGQLSVDRHRAARWLWPAAFAAMSAIAAGLLAMLMVRGEPQVIERVRVVQVPASSGPSGSHPDRESQPPRDSRLADATPPKAATREPVSFPATSSSGSPWWPVPLASRRTQMLQEVLRAEADRWENAGASAAGHLPRGEGPVPYLEQRQNLLDEQGTPGSPSTSGVG